MALACKKDPILKLFVGVAAGLGQSNYQYEAENAHKLH